MIDSAPHPALINTFSLHCRRKYGHVLGKVPLDVGVICPNRAQGGCIFCRPESFSPRFLHAEDDLGTQLRRGKENLAQLKFRWFFGYFQQESCTSLDAEKLISLIKIVLDDPDCCGIILSTRPDLVPQLLLKELAKLFASSSKECLVELGLQSIHQKSLTLLNRNHTYENFCDAVRRIQAVGTLEVGAHLILGIPGESETEMVESVRTICRLGVRALKIHHLQVVKDTVLEKMYLNGSVKLFSLEEYLSLLEKIIPYIPENVTIHRFWATCRKNLLIAPKWDILTGSLSVVLQQRLRQKGLYQGMLAAGENGNDWTINQLQSL
jgi:radical SAM protein (TIGR01212 family)